MGAYIYTFRKKQVNVLDLDGRQVKANLFDYAYKPGYSFMPSRRLELLAARMESAAQRAYESYDGQGLVVVGDLDDGQAGLRGANVYRAVRSYMWNDCAEFPGTPYGYIELYKGNRLSIVTSLGWEQWRGTDRESRDIIRDGKFCQEVRCVDDHYPIYPGLTVDDRGNRLHDLAWAQELYNTQILGLGGQCEHSR